jgi:hypothetical protein
LRKGASAPWEKEKELGTPVAKREIGECISKMKGTKYYSFRVAKRSECTMGKGKELGMQLLKGKWVSAQVK